MSVFNTFNLTFPFQQYLPTAQTAFPMPMPVAGPAVPSRCQT